MEKVKKNTLIEWKANKKSVDDKMEDCFKSNKMQMWLGCTLKDNWI